MNKKAWLSIGIILSLLSPIAMASECVVLLHGLAKSSNSMEKMAHQLEAEGFETVNQSYPSTSASVRELSNKFVPEAIAKCPQSSTIHFVTHSMGGILIRAYLDEHQIDNLGRVVMLAPPNQGSELVDLFEGAPGFKAIGGPASQELGVSVKSTPRSLGGAYFDLGIIAGNRSINPILSTLIPTQDDGKVSVNNTRLDGMKAHLIVPSTHVFIMKNPWVIEQTIEYLKNGHFNVLANETSNKDTFSLNKALFKDWFWQPYLACKGACKIDPIETKSP